MPHKGEIILEENLTNITIFFSQELTNLESMPHKGLKSF